METTALATAREVLDRVAWEAALGAFGASVMLPLTHRVRLEGVYEGGESVEAGGDEHDLPASVVLNQHLESALALPDFSRIVSLGWDKLREWTAPAALAMAEALDSRILNHYVEFFANAPIFLGEGRPVTLEFLDTVSATVLASGSRGVDLVASPLLYSLIRQLPGVGETGGVRADEPRRYLSRGSLRIHRSLLVPKVGAVTHNLALGSRAVVVACARLAPPEEGSGKLSAFVESGGFEFRVTVGYDPNPQRQTFSLECLFGTSVLRNDRGVQVNS